MKRHQTREFGRMKDGRAAHLFAYLDDAGMGFYVTDYGAALTSLLVPDKDDILTDVLLGFEHVSGYEAHDGYMGAVCGRVANRIGRGEFALNGQLYKLTQNEGQNHLHGGINGFDKKIWQVSPVAEGYRLELFSPDKDEGYPGALTAVVTYRWIDGRTLEIIYRAEADGDTICNLTNHAYFNLNGPRGSALDQKLFVNADAYTPTDNEGIPTGEILPVSGSLDLREPRLLRDVLQADDPLLENREGLDHNFVLTGNAGAMRRAAILTGVESGISLQVDTDAPGLQVYSGQFLRNWPGKAQAIYGKNAGIALETQLFPDAPNQEGFPSALLCAGEIRESKTMFSFDPADSK